MKKKLQTRFLYKHKEYDKLLAEESGYYHLNNYRVISYSTFENPKGVRMSRSFLIKALLI